MKQKLKINELTRLAFIYAEQDRRSLGDAYSEGSEERKQYYELAEQFRQYRLKKWGKTEGDVLDESSKQIDINRL